jgi:hypothetical protein
MPAKSCFRTYLAGPARKIGTAAASAKVQTSASRSYLSNKAFSPFSSAILLTGDLQIVSAGYKSHHCIAYCLPPPLHSWALPAPQLPERIETGPDQVDQVASPHPILIVVMQTLSALIAWSKASTCLVIKIESDLVRTRMSQLTLYQG